MRPAAAQPKRARRARQKLPPSAARNLARHGPVVKSRAQPVGKSRAPAAPAVAATSRRAPVALLSRAMTALRAAAAVKRAPRPAAAKAAVVAAAAAVAAAATLAAAASRLVAVAAAVADFRQSESGGTTQSRPATNLTTCHWERVETGSDTLFHPFSLPLGNLLQMSADSSFLIHHCFSSLP